MMNSLTFGTKIDMYPLHTWHITFNSLLNVDYSPNISYVVLTQNILVNGSDGYEIFLLSQECFNHIKI